MKAPTKEAINQLFQWAENWVENESAIPETPAEKLTDAEKGALLLIDLWNQKS